MEEALSYSAKHKRAKVNKGKVIQNLIYGTQGFSEAFIASN